MNIDFQLPVSIKVLRFGLADCRGLTLVFLKVEVEDVPPGCLMSLLKTLAPIRAVRDGEALVVDFPVVF